MAERGEAGAIKQRWPREDSGLQVYSRRRLKSKGSGLLPLNEGRKPILDVL